MNNFEAEGFNMKQGILWIDTEESDETWDEEQASIDAHLISKGYSKTGGGQFFSDRKYAWVMYRLQKYLTGVGEKSRVIGELPKTENILRSFITPRLWNPKLFLVLGKTPLKTKLLWSGNSWIVTDF